MKLFILPVLLSATTALASPIVGTWHCVSNTYIAQVDMQIEYFWMVVSKEMVQLMLTLMTTVIIY